MLAIDALAGMWLATVSSTLSSVWWTTLLGGGALLLMLVVKQGAIRRGLNNAKREELHQRLMAQAGARGA